jgi:segregation and condensation protein A
MQEELFSIITNRETITWKSMIFELISQHSMDPWDINISLLTKGYLKLIKKLEAFDFFLGGKVLLAASFLLKLKSVKLVDEHISEFDQLIAEAQRTDADFISDFYGGLEDEWTDSAEYVAPEEETPALHPRTPQPRKRKVSVYDLVDALQRAIDVHDRKVLRQLNAPEMTIPEKKRDISDTIREIYERIVAFFRKKGKRLTLGELIPSDNKEDIVQTFIPLLHLSHIDQRKIDLYQKEHFGEIQIQLHSAK